MTPEGLAGLDATLAHTAALVESGQWADQLRPFVPHVAHGRVYLEPLEYLGGFTLVRHHMLGTLLGCYWVQPFLCQVRCQNHGTSRLALADDFKQQGLINEGEWRELTEEAVAAYADELC